MIVKYRDHTQWDFHGSWCSTLFRGLNTFIFLLSQPVSMKLSHLLCSVKCPAEVHRCCQTCSLSSHHVYRNHKHSQIWRNRYLSSQCGKQLLGHALVLAGSDLLGIRNWNATCPSPCIIMYSYCGMLWPLSCQRWRHPEAPCSLQTDEGDTSLAELSPRLPTVFRSQTRWLPHW